VRTLLRDDLTALAETVREDVALVASELVCNAIRYGRVLPDGRIAIEWRVGRQGVEIAVTDGGGSTDPVAEAPGPTEIGGRGLSIVASVAKRWGVDRHSGGVTVWAVVPRRARSLTPV
jgi:anti-sigma regulatory factor (Ser/Thr protein kinase)